MSVHILLSKCHAPESRLRAQQTHFGSYRLGQLCSLRVSRADESFYVTAVRRSRYKEAGIQPSRSVQRQFKRLIRRCTLVK